MKSLKNYVHRTSYEPHCQIQPPECETTLPRTSSLTWLMLPPPLLQVGVLTQEALLILARFAPDPCCVRLIWFCRWSCCCCWSLVLAKDLLPRFRSLMLWAAALLMPSSYFSIEELSRILKKKSSNWNRNSAMRHYIFFSFHKTCLLHGVLKVKISTKLKINFVQFINWNSNAFWERPTLFSVKVVTFTIPPNYLLIILF